jgi:hypothetical protein
VDRKLVIADWSLEKRNIEFIESIDPSYYLYLASVHSAGLNTEKSNSAALALRSAFHHGVETLMTIIGAMLQAPDCTYAWAPLCSTVKLIELASAISGNGGTVFNKHGIDIVDFGSVASLVFRWLGEDAPKERAIGSFAQFWRYLADEFVSEFNRDEYNGIKHGCRVRPGGFKFAIQNEVAAGIAEDPSSSIVLGQSKFGSSFTSMVVPVGLSSKRSNSLVLYPRRTYINWSAAVLVQSLQFIACSISSIRTALLIMNRAAGRGEISYSLPEDLDAMDLSDRYKIGINRVDLDADVGIESTRDISMGIVNNWLAECPMVRNIPK